MKTNLVGTGIIRLLSSSGAPGRSCKIIDTFICHIDIYESVTNKKIKKKSNPQNLPGRRVMIDHEYHPSE